MNLSTSSVPDVSVHRDELANMAPKLATGSESLLELTILMPCLNEVRTLAACIQKAQTYLASSGVQGEVLVADNGSSDGSQALARSCGARVVEVPRSGYGAALMAGPDTL